MIRSVRACVKNYNICCMRVIKEEDNDSEEDPFADVDKLEALSEPDED